MLTIEDRRNSITGFLSIVNLHLRRLLLRYVGTQSSREEETQIDRGETKPKQESLAIISRRTFSLCGGVFQPENPESVWDISCCMFEPSNFTVPLPC